MEVLDLDLRGYIINDSIIINDNQEFGLAGSFPDPNILDPDKRDIKGGGLYMRSVKGSVWCSRRAR